jgi:hypothetical protein
MCMWGICLTIHVDVSGLATAVLSDRGFGCSLTIYRKARGRYIYRATGLTSQPSIHVYGSVGSVSHRDVEVAVLD